MQEKDDLIEMDLCFEDKKKLIRARLCPISKKEALKKALFFWLASLSLAFISSFIPLVHFVAVPSLLIFGPFIAFFIFKTYHNRMDLLFTAQVFCLNCGEKLSLPSSYELYPLNETCLKCKERFELRLKLE